MRRSTAAVVGTLAGAAMLIGVRLTAQPVTGFTATQPVAAQPVGGDSGAAAAPRPGADAGRGSGTFRGDPVSNPYGTVQVTVRVARGKIAAVDASYPTDGNSGVVNGPAVPRLREAALAAQSADIQSVSGATYTSEGYRKSLQSALDRAGI